MSLIPLSAIVFLLIEKPQISIERKSYIERNIFYFSPNTNHFEDHVALNQVVYYSFPCII